jgi:hypothetical protein
MVIRLIHLVGGGDMPVHFILVVNYFTMVKMFLNTILVEAGIVPRAM